MQNGNDLVVLVTGGSRGLGRGIARQFGKSGATVYITGRPSSMDALNEAVAEIEGNGGKGIALAVDHSDDSQVEAAIARIADEAGRLDILVNNAAAVHPELIHPGPFWEKPLHLADMITVGLRSNYVSAYYAAPVMAKQRSGLIASISFYGAVSYFHGPAYGAAKAGTDKLSFDMAVDLKPFDVAAVSYWPGFIYTDFVASLPREVIQPDLAANLPNFERPEFTALILEAIHADPNRMALSGQAVIGAELGERYGIRDIDGKQPISYRAMMGAPTTFHST